MPPGHISSEAGEDRASAKRLSSERGYDGHLNPIEDDRVANKIQFALA
jgi:hypothetical protein